jgi:tryptophan synthase alpha chain
VRRLQTVFEQLQQRGRKALVPYIVAGDPRPELTVPLMHELVRQGVDIIELGVPFTDPMAEGPVIQRAHERALRHRVTLRGVLDMVAEFRREDSSTPVVLMGYANPVEHMGYEHFARQADRAGVDGVLIVDMPAEEADELNAALADTGIDNIFLLAPTTTDGRIARVAALASGYLYCVSLKGVTGAGNLDIGAVCEQLRRIKAHTSLPVTVGFGIKDAASAAAVGEVAEGVVVGSALVDRLAALAENAGIDEARPALAMIGEMRAALDAGKDSSLTITAG